MAAVEKCVELERMSVHVNVEHYNAFALQCGEYLCFKINSGVKQLVRLAVVSVQINASEIDTAVADDHSIRIEHGDYLEDEVLA